jgi:Cu-Zn family superoxide dismutase
MKLRAFLVVLAAASAAALFAAPPTRAVAVLHPTGGNSVEGQVTFSKTDGGVKVSGHITGLTPGKHGFHIHEFGDCTAPDGTSAGGHFNPAGAQHGAPTDAMRHEGDLGNVDANAQGVADIDYVDTHASFEGEASILGRGVIVHAAPDDFKTQPTGNAGARVACGVIGAAKAQ